MAEGPEACCREVENGQISADISWASSPSPLDGLILPRNGDQFFFLEGRDGGRGREAERQRVDDRTSE